MLKEVNPENSLEGLMLKLFNTLATCCEERLIGKDLDAGKY